MRVCVLAGFFACLTSSAPSADDRAGPWPAMPADVIAEEAVGYPQFRKARAVCIGLDAGLHPCPGVACESQSLRGCHGAGCRTTVPRFGRYAAW